GAAASSDRAVTRTPCDLAEPARRRTAISFATADAPASRGARCDLRCAERPPVEPAADDAVVVGELRMERRAPAVCMADEDRIAAHRREHLDVAADAGDARGADEDRGQAGKGGTLVDDAAERVELRAVGVPFDVDVEDA